MPLIDREKSQAKKDAMHSMAVSTSDVDSESTAKGIAKTILTVAGVILGIIVIAVLIMLIIAFATGH